MKLIFISDSLLDIEMVKKFAQANQFCIEHYSRAEWNQKQQSPSSATEQYPRNMMSLLPPFPTITDDTQNLDRSFKKIKEVAVKQALLRFGGNASQTAKALQIGRSTLYRIVKQYNIDIRSIRYQHQSINHNQHVDGYPKQVFKKSA